jgi:ubiquitin C-terminal hydrolase
MNATLQCLSQTEDLTNYFLDEQRSLNKIMNNNIALRNKNELQLSPVYLELVKNLWDKNNEGKYIKPKKFMETIEAMNPLFKLGQAGDSKDFIIFLLEQFHTELKITKNNNSSDDYPIINQYDQRTAFQNFFNEFKKQTSIISDIFFGIQETNSICLNCKNFYSRQRKEYPICYNYQIFNYLIFPLEEVRKYRYNNNNRINTVTLEDCFIYNQKMDYFTGDNKNYCNICKQTCDSNNITRIYSAPSTLILILNRGKNNCYNVKLNFSEKIDITDYVSIKSSRIIYNLYGVITHYGESGPSAHFLAFCKSPINKIWYRYNDAMVTPVNNVQKDVLEFENPYILFYKQQQPNSKVKYKLNNN